MSSQLFINHTAFNNDVVKYSAPKQNQSGGKSVNIYNKDTKLQYPIIPRQFSEEVI